MVVGLSHMISSHNGLNAGAIMSTLEEVVQGLVDDVTVARFKMGITWNPPHRWANDRYGYKMNYSRMHLLLVDQSPSKCGIYEAFLIRAFQTHAKLDNVKIGDDNRQNVAPHYVYLVTKLVGLETTRWTPERSHKLVKRWTADSNAPIAVPAAAKSCPLGCNPMESCPECFQVDYCPACGNRRGEGNPYTCLCDEAEIEEAMRERRW